MLFSRSLAKSKRRSVSVRPQFEPLEERALLAVVPIGPEFLVGASQNLSHNIPSRRAIAMDRDGDFVVIWKAYPGDTYGQRYDSEGVAQGSPFNVGSPGTVAMDEVGNFVFASGAIEARLFNFNGQQVGQPIQVISPEGDPRFPNVAMDESGFIVAWSGPSGIFVKRYSADGTPIGSAISITLAPYATPSVALKSNGDYVVAWAFVPPTGETQILARYFSADGTPLTDEILVGLRSDGEPQVAMDANGNFAIAWAKNADIHARLFDNQGVARGAEFQVPSDSTFAQQTPAIAMDAHGNFVITWASRFQDHLQNLQGGGWGIFGRYFSSSGEPRGEEFRVNTTTLNDQYSPSVAMDAKGSFVVVWTTWWMQDWNDLKVKGQRFQANFAPQAEAGGPYSIVKGDALNLDASDSSDPDDDPLTFSWDVNGDGIFGDVTGSNPTLSWVELISLGVGPSPATFAVRVRVDDGYGHIVESASTTLTVVNRPPLVNAGGPYSISEGEPLNLNGSGSSDPDNDPLSYSWDLNGDSNFSDASGMNPTITWAELQALGIDDGLSQFAVRVRVDDGNGHVVDSLPTTLTVNNAPPVPAINGPTTGVRGQPRTFLLSATDASAADLAAGFAYSVSWGDGSPTQTIAAIPGNSAGAALNHVFTNVGTFFVQLTATDKSGAQATVVHAITISTVGLQADPDEPSKTALVIGGTVGNDVIIVKPANLVGAISVVINGVSQGNFRPTGRIIAYAQAGNDSVELRSRTIRNRTVTIKQAAMIYGDAGNDRLDTWGSTANNALLGGNGNDMLLGGAGRDLIIGGISMDTLHGRGGQDILIGGSTIHDANLTALCALMAEWGRRNANFDTRVQHLTGGMAGGLNTPHFLNRATVVDDRQDDLLDGGADRNWLFAETR